MTPFDAADAIQARLTGRRITPDERARFGELFREIDNSGWIGDMMARCKLAGTTFVLDKQVDLSGLGTEMIWMTLDQMVDEANATYPGIVALKLGFLPVGNCAIGSGDPYFLNVKDGPDPPVVRIRHDAVLDENALDEESIELVSHSLSAFLQEAQIE